MSAEHSRTSSHSQAYFYVHNLAGDESWMQLQLDFPKALSSLLLLLPAQNPKETNLLSPLWALTQVYVVQLVFGLVFSLPSTLEPRQGWRRVMQTFLCPFSGSSGLLVLVIALGICLNGINQKVSVETQNSTWTLDTQLHDFCFRSNFISPVLNYSCLHPHSLLG